MSETGNPFARFALASARSAGPLPAKKHADGASAASALGESGSGKQERKRERSASPAPAVGEKKARADESDGREDRRVVLLNALLAAREEMETPIDRFGTQACVWPAAGESAARFQLLVAALLSSQTKDEITFAAMQRLHAHSNDGSDTDEGLTVASVLTTSAAQLGELLQPVGFYRRKAQQLLRVAATLRAQFNDDVPRSLGELEALPGVGPKIARVVLLLAWHRVDGVIVDTHVHRLARRFGWAGSRSSTKDEAFTAEDTRRELEAWLPREHWGALSLAVVGFGQSVCTARRPACAACPLAQLCPSAFQVSK
jgi:endonuclease-3